MFTILYYVKSELGQFQGGEHIDIETSGINFSYLAAFLIVPRVTSFCQQSSEAGKGTTPTCVSPPDTSSCQSAHDQ
jgi:hypothetical protein